MKRESVSYKWEPKFNKRVPIHKKCVHVSLKRENVTYKWEPKFNKRVPIHKKCVHVSLKQGGEILEVQEKRDRFLGDNYASHHHPEESDRRRTPGKARLLKTLPAVGREFGNRAAPTVVVTNADAPK